MVAPKGNQFWKARSKHGRGKIIQDPKFLVKAADEYFQWCVDNPIEKMDFKGKDAATVFYKIPRPFKKNEFARFCGVCNWTVIEKLKENEDLKIKQDFINIVTHVEDIIYEQKYDMAAVGLYNSSIIARDLGLKDRSETTNKDKFNSATTEELDERIKVLQSKSDDEG